MDKVSTPTQKTAATSTQKTAATSTQNRSVNRFRLSRRGGFFIVALALLAIVTQIAYQQAPKTDPYHPPEKFSLKWWLEPAEENAFLRATYFNTGFEKVFTLPGTEKMWAVGDKGLIAHSQDGGATWRQQRFPEKMFTKTSSRKAIQTGLSDPKDIKNAKSFLNRQLEDKRSDLKRVEARLRKIETRFTRQYKTDQARVKALVKKKVVSKKEFPQSLASYAKRDKEYISMQVAMQGEIRNLKRQVRILEDRAEYINKTEKSVPKLTSVYFADDLTGWIVGERGTVLATTDGGLNWDIQAINTSDVLLSAYFVSKTKGWVAGYNGQIFVTDNGGRNWSQQPNTNKQALSAIFFVNKRSGWAAGADGVMLATNNGGQSWVQQSSKTTDTLMALYFNNILKGTAVGDNGTIVVTRDGGETWQTIPVKTKALFRAVTFNDVKNGWAVGDDGVIAVTGNGGQSWDVLPGVTNSSLRSVYFSDASNGVASGWDESLLTISKSGDQWQVDSSQASQDLTKIFFFDNKHGWAVGRKGSVIATIDGGETWTGRSANTNSTLHAVHFVSPAIGWISGEDGTILTTSDGGLTWLLQPTSTKRTLFDVFFSDKSNGWAVGVGGTILQTIDGGQSWETKASEFPRHTFYDVHFIGERGWIAGSRGTLITSLNAGEDWIRQRSKTKSSLVTLTFIDKDNGWAAGDNGKIISTNNGGRNWTSQTSKTDSFIRAIKFRNKKAGRAITNKGTILTTVNGGDSWEIHSGATPGEITHASILDDQRSWAVSLEGRIYGTSDGGKIWVEPEYTRTIAPWYYLGLLLVIAVLIPVLKRPEPIEHADQSIANVAISDRPLKLGDPDPLKFNAIARGLSRFLRNENSEPPVTIAVTGKWGSGKSSLMNLLSGDLKKHGTRAVWFNAWHHQRESQMLAALLENIRQQALPSIFSPAGIAFRVRLLWQRGWRQKALLFVVLAVVSATASYLSIDGNLMGAWAQLKELLTFKSGAWSSAGTDKLLGGLLGPVFSLYLVTTTLWKNFSAFGMSPTVLLKKFNGKASTKQLREQTGFRHQFSNEFKDVTRALNPYQMVIMIDDLDRCRPEAVLEVMEAVNFLSAAGECYIVLGMDMDIVRSCIGLGFETLAEEMANIEMGEKMDTVEMAKQKRREFARKYLEKLINIEVPIPMLDPAQSRNLLVPPVVANTRQPNLFQRFIASIPGNIKLAAPWVLAGIAIFTGVIVGQSTNLSEPEFFIGDQKQAQTVTKSQSDRAVDTEQNLPLENKTKETVLNKQADDSNKITEDKQAELIVIEGKTADYPFDGLYLTLLLFLFVGAWFWTVRPDIVLRDSKDFKTSLAIWHDVIAMHCKTPRSVKRFLNRVRYLAMFQAKGSAGETIGSRLRFWWNKLCGKPTVTEVDDLHYIPEPVLVALSAINLSNPDWLKNNMAMSAEQMLALFERPPGISDDMVDAYQKAIQLHLETFASMQQSNLRNVVQEGMAGSQQDSKWPPTPDQVQEFFERSAGIRVA